MNDNLFSLIKLMSVNELDQVLHPRVLVIERPSFQSTVPLIIHLFPILHKKILVFSFAMRSAVGLK